VPRPDGSAAKVRLRSSTLALAKPVPPCPSSSRRATVDGAVIAVVAEIVGAERPEEAADAVDLDLVGHPVLRTGQGVGGEAGDGQRRQQEVRDERPAAPEKRPPRLARRAQPRPEQAQQQPAEQGVGEQHRQHRVAVPDVDQNLVRIDEVVDGHQIEARIELLEEEELGHRQVDAGEDQQVAEESQ